jgi:hypothetical protein
VSRHGERSCVYCRSTTTDVVGHDIFKASDEARDIDIEASLFHGKNGLLNK